MSSQRYTQKRFWSILIFVHRPAGYSCICGGAFSKTCLKSSFYDDTSHSTHRIYSVTRFPNCFLRIWAVCRKTGCFCCDLRFPCAPGSDLSALRWRNSTKLVLISCFSLVLSGPCLLHWSRKCVAFCRGNLIRTT